MTSDDTPAAATVDATVEARPGSGTVEIDKTAVEVNRLYTDFTIKYTAAAEIEGAYFMVTLPTETLGTSPAFMMLDPVDDTQIGRFNSDGYQPSTGQSGSTSKSIKREFSIWYCSASQWCAPKSH